MSLRSSRFLFKVISDLFVNTLIIHDCQHFLFGTLKPELRLCLIALTIKDHRHIFSIACLSKLLLYKGQIYIKEIQCTRFHIFLREIAILFSINLSLIFKQNISLVA